MKTAQQSKYRGYILHKGKVFRYNGNARGDKEITEGKVEGDHIVFGYPANFKTSIAKLEVLFGVEDLFKKE